MSKWFEEIDSKNSNVIYSRVRLARNWDEYVFPSRMTAAQCSEMVERLREGLKGLKDQDGRDLSYSQLDQMQELEKMALRERRILNMACVSRKEPSGLLLSADESGSVVLGGDDHIRMQMLSPGLKLDELWQKADVLDDYVNERFSYAFDEKYGYLTSFPTNVGTGLRACAVLHLPTLIPGAQVPEHCGGYEPVSAPPSAACTERAATTTAASMRSPTSGPWDSRRRRSWRLVTKAAAQLNNQEMRVRSASP